MEMQEMVAKEGQGKAYNKFQEAISVLKPNG